MAGGGRVYGSESPGQEIEVPLPKQSIRGVLTARQLQALKSQSEPVLELRDHVHH